MLVSGDMLAVARSFPRCGRHGDGGFVVVEVQPRNAAVPECSLVSRSRIKRTIAWCDGELVASYPAVVPSDG